MATTASLNGAGLALVIAKEADESSPLAPSQLAKINAKTNAEI
jgi:hypothetical protein